MVLKCVVTEEIEKFYENNSNGNYDFIVSRGTIVFYSNKNIINFKLIYTLNNKFKNNQIECTINYNNNNKMVINRIVVDNNYKYMVTLPQYIVCGKYNLYCTTKVNTEKLSVIVLPSAFSKLNKHHTHQMLSYLDNKLFSEIDNYHDYGMNMLCDNEIYHKKYLINMYIYLTENIHDNNQVKKYLACIGFVECISNNDDVIIPIIYKFNKSFISITQNNNVSNDQLQTKKNIYIPVFIKNINVEEINDYYVVMINMNNFEKLNNNINTYSYKDIKIFNTSNTFFYFDDKKYNYIYVQ